MLPHEVLRQIRYLQVRARRAVESLVGGEYHSVFKGMGIAFEEVREYQPGDDIRTIDWNVTARMGHPFIKRFIEERELTVLLVIDGSGSQEFGTGLQQKRDVTAELAAVLAFSAISNNDKVGLMTFTDRVERFVPPRKGSRHVLRLIRDILFFQPEHRGTSLREALDYLNRVQRRRAIVFLLSDFLDQGFERAFKHTAKHHDLIALRIADPREAELPPVGLLELEDAETGDRLLVDAGSRRVREAFATHVRQRRAALRQLAHAGGADLVEISTDGSHLDALLRFFRLRERQQKLAAHLRVDQYGQFRLTEAVRPSLDLQVVPREGYRLDTYKDARAGIEVPVLVAAVSRERLFDVFLDLLDPLGEAVDVVLETSHDSEGSGHDDLYREQIDLPVLKSHCYDYEDLLLNDGCTGIAVISGAGPMEVQFDEHKLLVVYAQDLEIFEEILRQHGVERDDHLKLITEGEHLHSTEPHYAATFEQFCFRLGVGETAEHVNW